MREMRVFLSQTMGGDGGKLQGISVKLKTDIRTRRGTAATFLT